MKFKKTTLKNGLRIITVPMKDNPAVTVLVMVEAGAKYETKETNGISHFLEHMVFKGTPRRPKASMISREFDGLGAESNAFTSEEYTGYYAKVAPKHVDKALDIISDMYLNPLFLESEIAKEKGVIIEEIRMYRDKPQSQAQDIIGNLLYGNQPAGFTVLGPEENIRSFSQKDFIEYRKKHYVAKATTVIVSGNIVEKEIIQKIRKLFADIPTSKKHPKLKVVEHQTAPQVALGTKKTDQTHMILALRTFAVNDRRAPAMRVLSAILGRGMSSRLFTRMRDELGICYYIRSSHDIATDHGVFSVSAGVDTTRVEIGIENILSELRRMKTELVSKEELRKAKDFISGTTSLRLETSDARAEYVGHQEIIGKKIIPLDETMKAIEKVTAEQIRKLAQTFFITKNLNLVVVGPFEDKKKFSDILKI